MAEGSHLYAVAMLLGSLWEMGAGEQTSALAEHAAAHVCLDHPAAVGMLLHASVA